MEAAAVVSDTGEYEVPYDGWLYIEALNYAGYHLRARINGCRVMAGAGSYRQIASAFVPVRRGDKVLVTWFDPDNDRERTHSEALKHNVGAFDKCTFIMYAYEWSK
jgi:hypothetical protein